MEGVVEIKIKRKGHKHNYKDISPGLFKRIIRGYKTKELEDQIELDLLEKQLNVVEMNE